MKITSILSIILVLSISTVLGQGNVRFSNITELGAGFQVGNTTRELTYTDILGNEQSATSNPETYKIPAPRLMTSFGVMLFDLIFVGAGAGYQFQANEDPLPYQHNVMGFGQLRLHFAKGRFRPFTDLRLGYNYTLNQNTNDLLSTDYYKWDGIFAEPSLGMAFKVGEKALFNIGLAYQFLRTDQREVVNASLLWQDVTTSDKQHRLIINLGFTFK
ncbi:MAG: hypothetical protein K9J06_00105 [Flavobacteriales bacterium]|nr:hypothetical protein [Flavobacteriales bacterium]